MFEPYDTEIKKLAKVIRKKKLKDVIPGIFDLLDKIDADGAAAKGFKTAGIFDAKQCLKQMKSAAQNIEVELGYDLSNTIDEIDSW